jgi:hypothetical protein
MRCYICDGQISLNDEENHNNRTIGVKYNDHYYCIPCHEIVLFMEVPEDKLLYDAEQNEPTTHINATNTQPPISQYFCMKCKRTLNRETPTCPDCNWSHPQLCRISKKTKKRRNK